MILPPMKPGQVESLLIEATLIIEEKLSKGVNFEDHSTMAGLHYKRAQMYVVSKKYNLALEDYTACLDYDPYFYDADSGRDKVYRTIKQMESMTTAVA